VDKIDKERIKDDKARFPFGMPNTDNGNYLWIQLFYSDLNSNRPAGFVMANSAADARGSELEIRKRIIQAKAVDVMVSIGPNFLLYGDAARHALVLRTRARRARNGRIRCCLGCAPHLPADRPCPPDFTAEHIEFIANIVRLYRGEVPETKHGNGKLLKESSRRGSIRMSPACARLPH